MVLPDEESCIRAALQTCGKPFDAAKKVVRIRSTLHLTHCGSATPCSPISLRA